MIMIISIIFFFFSQNHLSLTKQQTNNKTIMLIPILLLLLIIIKRAKGLPVVTTVLGLNGIGLTTATARGVLEVHDDGPGFAAAVQSLDEDDTLWATLSYAAVAHVRDNLNEASQRKVLNKILRPVLAR